jgi:hypothetical protein
LNNRYTSPSHCIPHISSKPITKLTAHTPTDANTTLRHPDADTSQNASIEEKDISLSKTHSRHSSFQFAHSFSSRHKTTLSRGIIDPTTLDGLYDNVQYADGTKERKSVEELTREAKAENGNGVMGAVAEAPSAVRMGEMEGQRMENGEKGRDSQEHLEGERKRGMLRKLHLHK